MFSIHTLNLLLCLQRNEVQPVRIDVLPNVMLAVVGIRLRADTEQLVVFEFLKSHLVHVNLLKYFTNLLTQYTHVNDLLKQLYRFN